MSMKLLTINIKNFYKKYKNKIVYNNFNLLIDNKKVNFLVSPNGIGKSTLIKAILNLISYKGLIITNLASFAYCPEKVLLPEYLKVKDFLNLFDINETKKQNLLTLFKVNENLHLKNLSKGMHQKVLLIQALAVDADGYFFDEPLNGLDKQSECIFIAEIKKLYNIGKMIIISSHYVERYNEINCNIIEL